MANNIKIFKPCDDLFANLLNSKNYGILVLNSKTTIANPNVCSIWNQVIQFHKARIRVLVDGGAESWISWTNNPTKEKSDVLLPHLVTGDFDSIRPETLDIFKRNDLIQVINTPDQNETDFTKALREFRKYQEKSEIKIEDIYVVTEVEGRLDHVMGNINTLFKAEKILPDISVFLLSSDSISWLLAPGAYLIKIPQLLRDNQECCGLIPVGSSATVTTSGLKWNLNKTKMSFGEIVSTSNTYNGSPEVGVQTDCSILWTMSISTYFKE